MIDEDGLFALIKATEHLIPQASLKPDPVTLPEPSASTHLAAPPRVSAPARLAGSGAGATSTPSYVNSLSSRQRCTASAVFSLSNESCTTACTSCAGLPVSDSWYAATAMSAAAMAVASESKLMHMVVEVGRKLVTHRRSA